MSKKGKMIAAAFALAAIALVVWTVMTIPEPPEKVVEEPSRTMSYDGNTLSEEKDGRKVWDLTADHIEIDIDTQNAKLANLTAHFYEKDGRSVEVKADEGEYTASTRDVAIKGNVEITTSDGAKLSSDSLEWTSASGLLAAIGNAKAEKDDMKASGDRIESTDGFGKIKIIGHAHIEKGIPVSGSGT